MLMSLCFRYLEPTMQGLLYEEFEDDKFSKKFKKLNKAIASMVNKHTIVIYFSRQFSHIKTNYYFQKKKDYKK